MKGKIKSLYHGITFEYIERDKENWLEIAIQLVGIFVSVLIIAYAAMAGFTMSNLDKYAFVYEDRTLLKMMSVISLIVNILFPFMLVSLVFAWKKSYWSFYDRVVYSIETLVAIGMILYVHG
ncbi:MAG: hypothetical protein N2484_02620 [Clostridia bacterium]|nr:hypothetical protein [Clostridia bacterium]